MCDIARQSSVTWYYRSPVSLEHLSFLISANLERPAVSSCLPVHVNMLTCTHTPDIQMMIAFKTPRRAEGSTSGILESPQH